MEKELVNKERSKDYWIYTKLNPEIHTNQRFYDSGIDLNKLGINKNQLIILSEAGSTMYGTALPESDKDYIGVYIPLKEDMYLNSFKHHIRLQEDNLDINIWSIHEFLKLACDGETLAIDLLHSPYNCWVLYDLHVWPWLVSKKNLFYTKGMSKFVSFSMVQANKYSIKGERVKAVRDVVVFLKKYADDVRLGLIWDKLPKGPHINFLNDAKPVKLYEICGRKFQETVKISYILGNLEKVLTDYGKRAKLAENNDGVDWKSLSHAIRAAEQVYWILKHGSYSFPLKNSNFIKQVKMGKIDIKVVRTALDAYMQRIEEEINNSDLQETVDREFWDKWLIELLESYLI